MTENKIQSNALEALRIIMQGRNWHQQKYSARKASGYKNLLNKGKLSYEKCSEILNAIGYSKIKEEVWKKN